MPCATFVTVFLKMYWLPGAGKWYTSRTFPERARQGIQRRAVKTFESVSPGKVVMKFCSTLMVMVLLGWATLSWAAENPRCIEEYQAEVEGIQRDAMRDAVANPPGRDIQAQQQFMIPVERALKAAAERARQCEEESRGKTRGAISAAANQRAQHCIVRAEQEITALRRRYAGRADLSRDEQKALREEENRIGDARQECLRKAATENR